MKIIIVDDEVDLLEAHSELLKGEGYNVESFTDARKALSLAPFEGFFLILSDFKMPQMNGIDFCKKVRESNREIPFLILTGYADKEMAIEGINSGVTGIHEKPINPEMILSEVKKYSDIHQNLLRKREEENRELMTFFIDETRELYSDLEETIMRLEQRPLDLLIVDVLFRKIHSVKGGASAVPGAQLLAHISHDFESRLSLLKNEKYNPSEEEVALFLEVAHLSMKVIDGLEKGTSNELATEIETACAQLKSLPKGNAPFSTEISIDSIEKENIASADGLTATGPQPAGGAPVDLHEEEIMVKNSQLDSLMRVVGEMVILKNYYLAMASEFATYLKIPKLVARAENFAHEMEKKTFELQSLILEVRKNATQKTHSKNDTNRTSNGKESLKISAI